MITKKDKYVCASHWTGYLAELSLETAYFGMYLLAFSTQQQSIYNRFKWTTTVISNAPFVCVTESTSECGIFEL